MRIAPVTIGSRGDVHPFIVLGKELRARSHDVVVATGPEFQPIAEQAGLGFRSLGDGARGFAARILASPPVRAALRVSPPIYRMARAAPRLDAADQETLAMQMAAAGAGADIVVNTHLTRIGTLVDPRAPWCSVSWWPITPTAAWPALNAPDLPLGGVYNRITHQMSAQLEWISYRPIVNRCRQRVGLSPLGLGSPFRELGRTRPLLYPFSPSVFPPPKDWPAQCHVTGDWCEGGAGSTREPPAELTAFVAGGPAPIVATFGSAWIPCGPELLEVVLGAAHRVRRRMVVIGGPAGDLRCPAAVLPLSCRCPADVLRVEEADYNWLLPRAAVIVHHGGSGTTSAVIKAGVPQVIVPCHSDQPMWAARMSALGVTPDPVPCSTVTDELLARTLRCALADPTIGAKAAGLSASVSADRGVETACDLLERWAETQGTTTRG